MMLPIRNSNRWRIAGEKFTPIPATASFTRSQNAGMEWPARLSEEGPIKLQGSREPLTSFFL